MKHPLQEMMDKRRQGIRCGIPSYCSANELVIEIALRRAKERNIPVLIEATANQVNQFGGYTGMKPADFYQMVLKMAKDIDLPENMMILAGDHLGPLTWQKLPEAEAMKNSVELVYQYARAGFTKIHLDTSMKVADDARRPAQDRGHRTPRRAAVQGSYEGLRRAEGREARCNASRLRHRQRSTHPRRCYRG